MASAEVAKVASARAPMRNFFIVILLYGGYFLIKVYTRYIHKMEATYCLIDSSGSMAQCLRDTIGGFNLFLDHQPENSLITTYTFDNNVKEMYRCSPASKAQRLNKVNYRPCGGTALLDAMGRAITVASNCTADIVNMVILTDGEENSSKEFTKSQIFEMIEDRKKRGWNFIFLGANQDAIKVADSFGIPENGAITFDTDCVESALKSTSEALERLRSGQTQCVEFSQLDRSASCPA